MRIRFFSQDDIDPAFSFATDLFSLQAVRETGTPILRVYSFPGDVVLLGRYHAIGRLPHLPQITVARRLSGGRVVPGGHGFVQFSLIFPHRSALFSDDPYNLAPFQVLNRHVRGVLQGLKTRGIDTFYPGRDLLTVRRQPVGWISFTTEESGALLCEGGLAVNRDFSLLPALLDRTDPQGGIPCQFFMPEQVTSLAQVTGTAPALAQVAEALRHGFAQQPNLEVLSQALSVEEQEAIRALAERHPWDEWLRSCSLRSDLPFHAMTATQLGVLHIRFALSADQTLVALQLSGDFIANPVGIAVLERGLRGCPLQRDALWQVVEQTFLQPEHYLLGVGPLSIIPDTILKGQVAHDEPHPHSKLPLCR